MVEGKPNTKDPEEKLKTLPWENSGKIGERDMIERSRRIETRENRDPLTGQRTDRDRDRGGSSTCSPVLLAEAALRTSCGRPPENCKFN